MTFMMLAVKQSRKLEAALEIWRGDQAAQPEQQSRRSGACSPPCESVVPGKVTSKRDIKTDGFGSVNSSLIEYEHLLS